MNKNVVNNEREDDLLSSLFDDGMESNKHFYYVSVQPEQKIHHFYLNNEFEEPYRYSRMFHIMSTTKHDDKVILHLNTDGGRLDTGVQLINTIRSCPGHVIGVIESKCHSLGAMIWLAAPYRIVLDNCIMLLHTYTSGIYGKGSEQEVELKATVQWFNELAKELFVPFLSESELKQMLQGVDFWMTTKEIRRRLKRVERLTKK